MVTSMQEGTYEYEHQGIRVPRQPGLPCRCLPRTFGSAAKLKHWLKNNPAQSMLQIPQSLGRFGEWRQQNKQ